MRIAAVGPTHPFRGGASHYTTLLVNALRGRHEVFFASYSRQYYSWMYPGSTDRDPSEVPVSTRVDERFDAVSPREWRALAERVHALSPDLVVLPWTVTYWAPFFYLFLKKLHTFPDPPKTLFLCHNVVEHYDSRLNAAISRRVLSLADFFVTHSRPDAEHLKELLGLPDLSRVRTSLHPEYRHLRTREVSREEARRHLGLTAERVALFFGLIRPYKGLDVLVEAWPLVVRELPVHLVIAGEFWGVGERECKERLAALGVTESVTLVPRYVSNEEVPEYFAAADVVLAPYRSATQSGIVQMAFGFDRPVVASRVGGLPEAIRDGVTGLLVPPCDPPALAAGVLDFFRSGCGPAMEEAIRSDTETFSWDRMVETIESFAG